jgi:alpha-tubulin suppressor-like RCC1 family protein
LCQFDVPKEWVDWVDREYPDFAGVATVVVFESDRLTGVSDISAGHSHSCASMDDGSVKCWGLHLQGSVHSTERARSRPETVVGLNDVVTVVGGGNTSCALTGEGGVVCWESNEFGDPAGEEGEGRVFTTVAGLEVGVVSLASGFSHFCAVTGQGRVLCWGSNSLGQLGDGSEEDSDTPVDVITLDNNQVAVAAGDFHSCALDNQGAVHCWGWSIYGTLGPACGVGFCNSVKAVRVGSDNNYYVRLFVGGDHNCAVRDNGTADCWGRGFEGQLGNGDGRTHLEPEPVADLEDIVTMALGSEHTCAIDGDGVAWCWGEGQWGQLGDTNSDSSNLPVRFQSQGMKAVSIAAGEKHTCMLTEEGQVLCVGSNRYNQLGDGTEAEQSSVPVYVVAE